MTSGGGLVHPVTQATAVGPFPGRAAGPALRAAGITHVLNVAAGHHDLDPARDQLVLAARPIGDATRLARRWLTDTLDLLHDWCDRPDTRVYVHCAMGQARAPTILWLYLCACGADPGTAADWIRSARPGAEPGHRALVDADVLGAAIAHGAAHFRPLARPAILERV